MNIQEGSGFLNYIQSYLVKFTSYEDKKKQDREDFIMKHLTKIKDRWKGLIDTILRFSMLIIFLVAAVLSNTLAINNGHNHETYVRLLVTFILGAAIYAVFQLLYERFFTKTKIRHVFMGITIALSLAYFLVIRTLQWDVEVTVRTLVILFILLIAFLWVPSIKSRVSFNETFMAAFKAFFMAIFFSGVLFLGVAILLGATNALIFKVNDKAFIHSANIIFLLFLPIHFLSLLPYYPQKEDLKLTKKQEEELDFTELIIEKTAKEDGSELDFADRAEKYIAEVLATKAELRKREEALVRLTTPAKFLEALISYVIIPITGIFTIILIVYIIMNITGDFWGDSLLEPLLVSYSIVVIIVYLLASMLRNAFARYFRLIFPKVLVPVVLVQTVSSVLHIEVVGITYGRYYCILFGVFATIAGIIFCLKPIKKNGLIAPILIGLSLISILPIIDVFTICRVTQIDRLESVLERNDMFDGVTITPKTNISADDRQIIVSSVQYLDQMGYTKDINWLSEYSRNNNLEHTFGFTEYEKVKGESLYISITRNQSSPIQINGYDDMAHMNMNNYNTGLVTDGFEKDGIFYRLRLDSEDNQVIILEKDNVELIRFNMANVYNKFIDNHEETILDTQEVTFTEDNPLATLTIIAENVNISIWEGGSDRQADIYALVKIK